MFCIKTLYTIENIRFYMELRDLAFVIIAILVAVVIFKIFMWLLPLIVVLLIAFFIYIFLSERYNY